MVLHDKYLLPKDQADMISSFLTPMLRLHPDKRAKASELVHHAWLDGIIVQGEIDLIRRAEEEELLKREAERKKASADADDALNMGPEGRARLARAEERHHLEEQIDADALKPVDDVAPQMDASLSGDQHNSQARTAHGTVTSSTGHKENQNHRHTPSKATVARIDTSGAKPTPTKSSTSKKRD